MRLKLILISLAIFAAFLGITFIEAETLQLKTVTLSEGSFVSIVGEVNGDSVGSVLNEISKSDPNKPLVLYLDSPGGSVFDGKKLVDYLQTTDRKITCVARTAISMAFIIFESCKVRQVIPSAVLMSHQISAQVSGSLKELTTRVDLMTKLEKYFDTQMAKRFELTLKEYTKKLDPEWWLIGAESIIINKGADETVNVKCTPELEKKTVIKEVSTFLGPMRIKENACPLL